MTAPAPEQMRALADERGVVVQHWGETRRWSTEAEAALRAAADQLEAVQALALTGVSNVDDASELLDRIYSLTTDTAPQEDRDE